MEAIAIKNPPFWRPEMRRKERIKCLFDIPAVEIVSVVVVLELVAAVNKQADQRWNQRTKQENLKTRQDPGFWLGFGTALCFCLCGKTENV